MAKKDGGEEKRREPRFYMKLAVEAMKNSVDELTKNSPCPRVGAVIVFPDGSYETACRGEFREGDHAEYTLLDKKFRTKILADCWLFATLEPCGPSARKFPKLCCAERIGNARIKKIWYGTQELNSKAKGGKKLLEELYNAEVLPFDHDLHKEILAFNKDFNDWVEEENRRETTAVELVSGPLQKTVINADLNSLSKEALELYIARINKNFAYNSDDLKDDLISKSLLVVDEKSGNMKPTGDCILLFGKNPRDKFPQASVKAKVNYGGNQEPDAESFDDALVLVPDKVKEWAKKVIPESMDRTGFTREKVSHFPLDVIREAIINAIIHRDYENRGAKVELEITPDKIEVRSPGEPVSPNSLKDLQNFKAISQTRNPELAYIFNVMKFMEETGVGMDTYRNMREQHGLPVPFISYRKPYLIITFPRSTEVAAYFQPRKLLDELNNEELKSFEILRARRNLSKTEFANLAGLPNRTAERLLKKFVDLKLVLKQGLGPSTIYNINEE
jgi:ATP-dependent DNA helicase RecG